MEQSLDENNREDDCGDNEKRNEVAATSKATFNDPIQTAHNVNDLKTLEFNSADEVRQTMKALINAEAPQQSKDIDHTTLKLANSKIRFENDSSPSDRNVTLRMKNDSDSFESTPVAKVKKDTRPNRKRPGRPPKSGPSKKRKRVNNADSFYVGKLSNLSKRRNRSDSSDLSLFSL